REAAASAPALLMGLTTVPPAPPGKQMPYSDLNAILLAEIIRRETRSPLDVFATRAIYTPLRPQQAPLLRPRRPRETPAAAPGRGRGRGGGHRWLRPLIPR